MTPNAYCTGCGARREEAKAYCTACGAKHPVAPPTPETMSPAPRPAPSSRALRYVECSSPIDSGLVCARCASRAAPPPSAAVAPKDVSPPPAPATRPSADAPAQGSLAARIGVAALGAFAAMLGLLFKYNHHPERTIALLAAPLRLGHGLDGTYVCGAAAVPLSVRIDGDRATVDMGVLRGDGMAVERHGDTVSVSGGTLRDAAGQLVVGEARRALTGGNDVDTFRLGDGEQTLTLDDGEGRSLVFTKQPQGR